MAWIETIDGAINLDRERFKIVLHGIGGVVTADMESIGDYTLNTTKTLTIAEAMAVYRLVKEKYDGACCGGQD